MKKFKKIIVAIMAMALALGMLTMTASAADYTDGGKLYIAGSFNDWKFEEMTGKDGVYTIEAEVEAGTLEFKCSPTGDWSSQINATGADGLGNNLSTTVEAGKMVITVDTTKLVAGDAGFWTGTDAFTVAPVPAVGDVAPIIAVSALALVALAGVIVCLKKRTVTE